MDVIPAIGPRRRGGYLVAAFGAAVLAVALRVPFFSWPLISDEGGYAYTAHWWSRGLTLYSGDLWLDRPQGIVAAYWAGMHLLGEATWAIRLWGALWAAATVLLVYAITRRILTPGGAPTGSVAQERTVSGPGSGAVRGERAGAIAALVCALFAAAPQIEGFTANAEVFSTTAALACVWLLLGRRYAAAGLIAAASCLLKPSGISVVVFALIWLAYEQSRGRRRSPSEPSTRAHPRLARGRLERTRQIAIDLAQGRQDERAGWRAVARFCIGGLTLGLLALVHGGVTAGWGNYVYAVAGHGVRASGTFGSQLGNLAQGASHTWPVWVPLALCAAAGCFGLPRRQVVFLAALATTSFLGMALGGHWFWHYFLQIVPPLAIGAGIAVDRWLRSTRSIGVAAIALLIVISEILITPFALERPATGAASLYGRPGYAIAGDVARYVRAHTSPSDRLYVAFAEPDIYHLAGRRCAVPNLFRRELLYIPGAYERVVAAIQSGVPVYVLALDRPMDELDPTRRFWRALDANYHVERRLGTARLYRRNDR